MTSPEKLATPDPVIELIEKIAVEWDGCEYDAPGESLDIGDAIRRKGFPLAHALRLATQRQGEGEPFTDAEIKDFTSMIWGAPCHGKDLALVAVVVKAMEQMNPGERPKDPARGGRLLDWDSLPMDLLEQGAQPMLDKLTATSQGVAVAQPDAPPCETCNGNGMIGGPCYREPDEGGVPCPDCGPAGAAQGEVK